MRAQPPSPVATPPAVGVHRWADAGLVSGEAVELDVRAARIGSRVLALLLDILAQAMAAVLLLIAVLLLVQLLPASVVDGALMNAAQTVTLIVVLVGYPVLFERLLGGRTPGKLAVGLRVVSVDGGPVGLRQSLTRALVGVAVEWPGLVLPLLSWVASVTVMLTDQRGRRLGDLVAGTMVVHTRTAATWRPAPMPAPPLVAWAQTLDLTRLDDALALAVRQYLTRLHQFAQPARAHLGRGLWSEVAAVTSPPPPPGAPEALYLAAALAERHRRTAYRLRRTRDVTAMLWPELAPAATPAGPPAEQQLRPAAPALPAATPTAAVVPAAAVVPTQAGPTTVRPQAPVAADRPGG